MTARGAAAEAGRRRFRPILMTSLTTILGLTPLALGFGEGAEAQAPLARAVIGGLTCSTLVTLLLVPAVYSLVHDGFRGGSAHENADPGGSATDSASGSAAVSASG
jgi:HAE1 family hydrophobic/amphiphilic exporter-1